VRVPVVDRCVLAVVPVVFWTVLSVSRPLARELLRTSVMSRPTVFWMSSPESGRMRGNEMLKEGVGDPSAGGDVAFDS
jgi:hypothetical protein